MTVLTPAFLNLDATYTAASLGLPYRDFIGEGVVAAADLAVAQRSAGANMSVDVAAGVAWVQGDDSTSQPTYRFRNDAVVNLAIAAADASNPRIDIVVAEVRDSVFSGVSNDGQLRVITGTPAVFPTVPAPPNNALNLAEVSVPALDTTIGTAQITDRRVRAQLGRGLEAVPVVTALPTSPYEGQTVDLQTAAMANAGIAWRFRYKAGGSYPWYFIGGGEWMATVETAQATSSTSYVDLATAGPSITLPLAGVYRIAQAAEIVNNTTGNASIMSFAVGGTAASDADRLLLIAAVNSDQKTLSRWRKKTVTTANAAIVSKYKAGNALATFISRDLSILPLQVG